MSSPAVSRAGGSPVEAVGQSASTGSPLSRGTIEFTDAEIGCFHEALRSWYAAHGRKNLPWRITRDAYAIWISEIMLQQTQVATVLARFYGPFLQRFPTIGALVAAERQEVLKAWEGLGYYRRAHMLHDAAITCVGGLPETADELVKLPGIGRNTANAVASFAHGEAVPVLEANVKRVVARIGAIEKLEEKPLWPIAQTLMDAGDPHTHNQAMMDIGALVCTPRKPDCPACPARVLCRGQHALEQYGLKPKKAAVPVRRRHIVITRDSEGRLQLQSRDTKLLQGLWAFPQAETPPVGRRLGEALHVYSHFRLEAEVWLVEAEGGDGFFSEAEIAALPMSGIDRKVLAMYRGQTQRLI